MNDTNLVAEDTNLGQGQWGLLVRNTNKGGNARNMVFDVEPLRGSVLYMCHLSVGFTHGY